MNTKRIGNIGEAKVLAKFVELGIPVYIPFGDNERVDLIAEFNERLNRIQIKTSIKAENGVMTFSLNSSTVHRKNGCRHIYSAEEIDYFACYNITRDKVFLLSVNEVADNTINIRYETAKNHQIKDIKFEENYLLENVLRNNCIQK